MNRILEGNKENYDVGVCYKFFQFFNLDEKFRLFNCKYDLDFMKCMVEDIKCMWYYEFVNVIDKFVIVLDYGFRLLEFGIVNEYEDVLVMSLKLSGDGYYNGRLILEVLSLCGGVFFCELKKLSGVCISDIFFFSVLVDIRICRCVLFSLCIRRDVVFNLVVMDNQEIFQGLYDYGDVIEEKFDLKISKFIGYVYIILIKKSFFYILCFELFVIVFIKCEVLVILDVIKV